MRKKFYLTKELYDELMSDVSEVKFSEEGKLLYLIHKTKKGFRLVKPHEVVTKHKYGKDLTYYYLAFNYKNRVFNISVADFTYAYHGKFLEEGQELDHIDNDPSNNVFDNLKAVSHSDNIKKRGIGRNKYTAGMSDEEVLALREKNKKVKEPVNIFDLPYYLGSWIVKNHLLGKVYKYKKSYYYIKDDERVFINLDEIKGE